MVMRAGEGMERVEEESHQKKRHWFKLGTAGVLAVVVIALAIANLDDVKVHFIVDDVKLPLLFIILGSALLGAIAATLFHWVRGRSDD
ncbi:MAG: hypothetical protein JWL73_3488 [Actinomycetia bacterium]|nr:hypothetical protein [Actinomycetes bacterium]